MPMSFRGLRESGVTDLQVAFSRANGQPRTYVQDLIEREQDHVWELLAAGAVIYVCGNARTMAPGVRAALSKIHQNKTERIN